MTRLVGAVLVAAMLGSGAIVLAQPHRPPPPGQGGDKRGELKKRIRLMRAYTLTEELALDEATTGKLFPVLAKYDDLTDKLLAQRADLQRKLSDPPVDPKAVDRLVDDSIANQHALWNAQDQRLAELRKVLTPAQTARLLVVLPALEKRIENQLREAAAGRGKGAGKGGKGPRRNNLDDDDDTELSPPGLTKPDSLDDRK